MSKMIQIRNVPDPLHRILKERAAREGVSLSDYLLVRLEQEAKLPTPEEIRERLARLGPANTGLSTVELIRQDRESH
jgi:antitoxin FitA